MRFMISLPGERIEDRDSGWLEVLDVAGDHGQAVDLRRGGDEGVDWRERLLLWLASPGGGDREGDRENPVHEPGLEVVELTPATGKASRAVPSAVAAKPAIIGRR
jgi:hypothetical protein